MPWTNDELAAAAQAATALIALGALFRPDIERYLQRSRAAIEMHPAGRLEVGFSNFGPTIGLQGTLRAVGRDQFINFAMVRVERLADHLRHDFQWTVFRAQSFSTAQEQTVEIASGFSLNVAAPRRFNIQFHDSTTGERIRQPLTDLQRLWTEYLRAQGIVLANIELGKVREIYDAFSKERTAEITPIFQLVDREFYWREGTYHLGLLARTSTPTREFSFNYNFNLSEPDSRLLRLSLVGCLLATCSVPQVTYNFAFPQYQPI
jgi:hypothetical protein